MSIIMDEDLLLFHTQMVDITLKTGYSPCQWHVGIEVMIKKEPGDYCIKNLQTILLFDAKFNSTQVVRLADYVKSRTTELLHQNSMTVDMA